MSDIIRLLPDSVANQIAAGEVVQRPASVVKELLENSLDAGASRITLVVRDAGRTLIQVTDDGKGMTETDARMCFERHATSKLATAADLFAIKTMGFRGEAMASIAAVAMVDMQTRLHSQDTGTHIAIEGSQVKEVKPVATQPGTRISVKNLFFNTPARRNFLKSDGVEMRHILDEFTRVALSRPDVAFSLFRGEEEVFRLQQGKLSQRIAGLFSKSYPGQIVPVQEEIAGYILKGYVGRPTLARRTRGEQFFFVNGRFIRHPFLHHAISTAFEGLVPDGYHPFYVLFIETEPARIDVNVHPTKTEVKFEDERSLYAIVAAAGRRALAEFQVAPSIDFDADANFLTGGAAHLEHMGKPAPASAGLPWYKQMPADEPPRAGGRYSATDLYAGVERFEQDRSQNQPGASTAPRALQTEDGQWLFPVAPDALPASPTEPVQASQTVFQFGREYLAAPVKSGLMILHIEAALERILFEQFQGNENAREGASQQTIFPVSVDLPAGDFALLQDILPELRALGFTLEEFGRSTMLVSGIPPGLKPGTEKELLEGLLEQYKQSKARLNLPRREMVARALAAKASRLQGRQLPTEEQQSLIHRLFACQMPNATPSGLPTTFLLKADEIGTWFGRTA